MRHLLRTAAIMTTLAVTVIAGAQSGGTGGGTVTLPEPASDLQAADRAWDGGGAITINWAPSPSEVGSYLIYRSMTPAEQLAANRDDRVSLAEETASLTRTRLEDEGVAPEDAVQEARTAARQAAQNLADEQAENADETRWKFVGAATAAEHSFTIDRLDDASQYRFQVVAVAPDGTRSAPIESDVPVSPSRQGFDGSRLWLGMIATVLCLAVLYFIWAARRGKPLKVRKIAGLAAVDEAVGRATEMGRPVLFIPGIQDMNDIQTVAGITILSRVGKTAAEYDAQVEVPTSRSLVMTAARETMHAAYLQAGRPDAFNPDLVYYVTDEQFGFVAYLSGMMVREKPAACFYMGSFFAESLILAETGNSIGAIQIAGTAQPAQLPFFVAACDYTLIGEEFFAASAYLSGEPDQLGSLKGQDVGKIIVACLMIVGCLIATAAAVSGNANLADITQFIRETMLT